HQAHRNDNRGKPVDAFESVFNASRWADPKDDPRARRIQFAQRPLLGGAGDRLHGVKLVRTALLEQEEVHAVVVEADEEVRNIERARSTSFRQGPFATPVHTRQRSGAAAGQYAIDLHLVDAHISPAVANRRALTSRVITWRRLRPNGRHVDR